MKTESFAKINLWLRVAGARPDGFHDIETVFHATTLQDELTVEIVGRFSDCEVHMTRPHASSGALPRERDNLAWRAWRTLLPLAPESARKRTRISIKKTIPLGGGLAGGSGNAAAVLVALNELWRLDLPDAELSRLAAEIGSDVPFMLRGGTMLGRGRGERLEEVPQEPALWFVLGISSRGLSTAEVYKRWRPEHDGGGDLASFLDALGGGPDRAAGAVRNDLQAPALELRPELAESIAALEGAGALRGFLSGSGPTVVGIARDEGHARGVASEVGGCFDRVEVVASLPSPRS